MNPPVKYKLFTKALELCTFDSNAGNDASHNTRTHTLHYKNETRNYMHGYDNNEVHKLINSTYNTYMYLIAKLRNGSNTRNDQASLDLNVATQQLYSPFLFSF